MPELIVSKAPIQSRHRVARALWVAARGFVITAAKTFYALWLEATGLIFAFLAVIGGSDLVRHHADNRAHPGRLLTVAGFTLVCAWFTVYSFVKARRTRR
jgi:hypothetical protein